MTSSWKEYQEEAAAFFRSLGLDASTDVSIKGVRTSHDVDVVVRSHHMGFDITWLVECQEWKTPVSKLHVLALRGIVTDVGADRGILLSEEGFQSGAEEAAMLTNVQVTSLAQLRETTSNDILSMRMRELYDRIVECKDRYWELPKDARIQHDLRPDFGELSYSGVKIIDFVSDVLSRAFRSLYPVKTETLLPALSLGLPTQFASPAEVVATVEPMVAELEAKLSKCEAALAK